MHYIVLTVFINFCIIRRVIMSLGESLLSIREVKETYNLSYYTLYGLIKTDPSFPCLNIGPKKNYRIQRDLFAQWLKDKFNQRQQKSFEIPTTEELLQIA